MIATLAHPWSQNKHEVGFVLDGTCAPSGVVAVIVRHHRPDT